MGAAASTNRRSLEDLILDLQLDAEDGDREAMRRKTADSAEALSLSANGMQAGEQARANVSASTLEQASAGEEDSAGAGQAGDGAGSAAEDALLRQPAVAADEYVTEAEVERWLSALEMAQNLEYITKAAAFETLRSLRDRSPARFRKLLLLVLAALESLLMPDAAAGLAALVPSATSDRPAAEAERLVTADAAAEDKADAASHGDASGNASGDSSGKGTGEVPAVTNSTVGSFETGSRKAVDESSGKEAAGTEPAAAGVAVAATAEAHGLLGQSGGERETLSSASPLPPLTDAASLLACPSIEVEDAATVLNGLRLLTRVMVVVLEVCYEKTQPQCQCMRALLWDTPAATAQDARPGTSTTAPPPPLAQRVLRLALSLLCCENFTLVVGADVGVSSSAADEAEHAWPWSQTSRDDIFGDLSAPLHRNRIAALRLLLVLGSEPLYIAPQHFFATRKPFLSLLVSPSLPSPSGISGSSGSGASFILAAQRSILFRSLLGTVLEWRDHHDALLDFNGSSAALIQVVLHALLLLLDFAPPSAANAPPVGSTKASEEVTGPDGRGTSINGRTGPDGSSEDGGTSSSSSSSNASKNMFLAELSTLSGETTMDELYCSLCSLMQMSVHTLGISQAPALSPLPMSSVRVECAFEAVALLWRALNVSDAFLTHVVERANVALVVEPLCCLLVHASQSASRVATLHLCAACLLLLAGYRSFAVRLNSRGPSASAPSSSSSSCLDIVIYAVFKVVMSGSKHLEAVHVTLLTVLFNVSPFCKSLSLSATEHVLGMLSALAAPKRLLKHGLDPLSEAKIRLLLESMNNIIHFQSEGNTVFIYSVLQRSAFFHQLFELQLEPQGPDAAPHSSSPTKGGGAEEEEPSKQQQQLQQQGDEAGRWQSLPFATLQQLLGALLPQLQDFTSKANEDETPTPDDILDFLRTTTVVGLLPPAPPITARRHHRQSGGSLSPLDAWLTAHLYGRVYVKENELFSTMPLALADKLKLFRVQ